MKEQLLTNLLHEGELWNRGVQKIAGLDEAGMGPLAGPVVAAAVILNRESLSSISVRIDDSKKLTVRQRNRAYGWIIKHADAWAVSIVNAQEIDEINIRQAAMKAMRKAATKLAVKPDHLLVDGRPLDKPPFTQTALIGGDRKSMSISAASIIAKVVRDSIMAHYHEIYPGYLFDRNKGYGTAMHIEALRVHGFSPVHRQTFRPKSLADHELYSGRK